MEDAYITKEEMLAIPATETGDPRQLSSEPMVSVLVITYNHELFIEQTIEGVLAQKCDFPIELIIGEDKSTDGTLEICLKYQQKRPEIIRVVTWHENVGTNANFFRVLGRARGKYIALCEGDDYWIDPAKLSKQVDLMEQFASVTLCGARTHVIEEPPTEKSIKSLIGPDAEGIEYSFGAALLRTYPFHTSTFMFRKSTMLLTRHALSVEYLDGFLLCLSALNGKIRSITDVVSVYRKHTKGMCTGSTLDIHFDRCAAVCRALLDIVDENDARLVKRNLDIVQSRRCHHLIHDGRMSEARALIRQLLLRLVIHDVGRALLLCLHIVSPRPYLLLKRFGKFLVP